MWGLDDGEGRGRVRCTEQGCLTLARGAQRADHVHIHQGFCVGRLRGDDSVHVGRRGAAAARDEVGPIHAMPASLESDIAVVQARRDKGAHTVDPVGRTGVRPPHRVIRDKPAGRGPGG
jgi:hypothetical protein